MIVQVIILVIYIVIGLCFVSIQDYDESESKSYNLLNGILVGIFWPIIALSFLSEDTK